MKPYELEMVHAYLWASDVNRPLMGVVDGVARRIEVIRDNLIGFGDGKLYLPERVELVQVDREYLLSLFPNAERYKVRMSTACDADDLRAAETAMLAGTA